MAGQATPCRRWIRSLTGAVLAAVIAAGPAVAQPFPSPPEPAKPPENSEVERPVVGVLDLRADKESEAIARAIQAAIGRRPELQGILNSSVGEKLIMPLIDEDTAAVDRARDRLDQAREQMANLQLDNATFSAREGTKQLIEVVPTPATTRLLADLLFAEGQAHFANQQRLRARASFALVHRLSPGRTLDPDSYLPELVEAFASAATASSGSATLDVTATGTVYLDGDAQGQGKQTLTVTPGLHIVVVTGPDRHPEGELVELTVGQTRAIKLLDRTASVDVKAFRARKAMITAPDATARAGAMNELAELAHITDAVIVTSDAKGGHAVQLWRDRAPGFQEVKPVTRILTPEEADRVIAPLVPKKPDPIDDGPTPLPLPPKKEWHEKTWVRASLVGGALAVIAGLVWVQGAFGAESRIVVPPVPGESRGE